MSSRPARQPLDPSGYAREVRSALRDLPARTLDELLEDLDEHGADSTLLRRLTSE